MIAGWQLNLMDSPSRHSKVGFSRKRLSNHTQVEVMQLTQGMEDRKCIATLSEVVERRKTFSLPLWEIIVFGFHQVQRHLHCSLLKNDIYSLFR